MTFSLHPNFFTKPVICELPLCRVLLENERHYPWIFLIPRRDGVSKIMDLSSEDQLQLMKELHEAQEILWKLFEPKQVNVAAIGNKTPQLHLHVIARFENDPAWPGTVWDHSVRAAYTESELTAMKETLAKEFSELS